MGSSGGGGMHGQNSNEPMEDLGGARQSEDIPSVVRHGYGVQYWTDGAHYEGQWSLNKAEG